MDELLSFEALEWLNSVEYKDRPHDDRMQLIRAAKILFSEETISAEGIDWLNSPEVDFVNRNSYERDVLLNAARVIYPNSKED